MDDTQGDSFSHQRHCKNSFSTHALLSPDDVWIFRSYRLVSMFDVNDFPVYKRSTRRRLAVNSPLPCDIRHGSIMSRQPHHIAFHESHDGIFRAANERGPRGDRLEHRFYVRWRAGDDPENLTRRCLLFQRLLEFLEQPHVL